MPTHNKQQFADSAEQRDLIKQMGEHMDQYKRDFVTSSTLSDIASKEFWSNYGYITFNTEKPIDGDNEGDLKYMKRRRQKVPTFKQCCKCLKWRELRYSSDLLNKDKDWDGWTCEQNTDTTKMEYYIHF